MRCPQLHYICCLCITIASIPMNASVVQVFLPRHSRAPSASFRVTFSVIPAPFRVIPAPFASFLRRQESRGAGLRGTVGAVREPPVPPQRDLHPSATTSTRRPAHPHRLTGESRYPGASGGAPPSVRPEPVEGPPQPRPPAATPTQTAGRRPRPPTQPRSSGEWRRALRSEACAA